jgi:glycosyltransferase involved in cell wall biosynthesis
MDGVAAYHREILRRGLSQDAFRFVDRRPVAEVPSWLAASDVLLMPFPDTLHYRWYMCPLKTFEYLTGLLRHEDNALLVPPDDDDALAAAILRLLDAPELAQRLADRAGRDGAASDWTLRARAIERIVQGR